MASCGIVTSIKGLTEVETIPFQPTLPEVANK